LGPAFFLYRPVIAADAISELTAQIRALRALLTRLTVAAVRNPGSADTHGPHRRLLDIGWITGFVDGEGCFSISLIRQPNRDGRKGYRTGLQLAHEFAVTQGAKSAGSLHMLANFFGVGAVYINRRYDNHKENVYRFCIRKRTDLQRVIVPFFLQYPLRTSKQRDFLKFAQCLQFTETKEHLTCAGLIKIVRITETMNNCKPRTDIIQELESREGNLPIAQNSRC
jgi:hypothetical protein